ncbi:hypothetical protein BYT27DRAFT_7251087 [Phlegmacium glaucopus]|nr:hypothetical protein BYT27DRAFT_7251087 [Phlegmacium glaucopus]
MLYTYANHGYPHGYVTLPGPQLLPPFQQFHPTQAPADGHTLLPPHSFFPEAAPGLPPVALPYLPPISYQTPFFVNPVPNPSFPLPTLCYTPPSSTHAQTFFHSTSCTWFSKSEQVEELADEVVKRGWNLSGYLPKVAGAATLEGLDWEVNRDS